MIIDNIPLDVPVSKRKKISLNLNVYRNLHYQISNKAKREMKLIIKNCCKDGCISCTPVCLIYTIYRKTNRRADIMNIGSVLDKFVSDALVEIGLLPDDNTDIIKKVTIIDGGVDKNNPHARLEIQSCQI